MSELLTGEALASALFSGFVLGVLLWATDLLRGGG